MELLAGQRQGSGKGSFPEGGFPAKPHHPNIQFFSISASRRVMLFRGAWAIEKGGSPCSFGRYGAQRHHFEAAHSIRLAPTDFRIQSALSRLMRSAHPRDPRPGRSTLATATYLAGTGKEVSLSRLMRSAHTNPVRQFPDGPRATCQRSRHLRAIPA